jgi:hypothetical protein
MRVSKSTVTPVVIILAGILLLIAARCTSSGSRSLHQLTDSEWSSINKLRSGQYTLIGNQELATLRQEAKTAKRVGRDQIHNEWAHTWRLEKASAHVCLQLSAGVNWNKPNITDQACNNNERAEAQPN